MGDVDWAFEDSKRHPVERDYDLGKQLGEGKFSIVHYAKNKRTGEEVAIKCIDRENTNPDELVHEAMLLQLVEEHPGIIKVRDVYEDTTHYYLIMEYVAGGELFDKIVQAEFYSEREAASIVRQITSIVQFIHEKGVVHRDLKPENLLCVDEAGSVLKLCDFGLADTIEDDELLTAIVGSTTYMAPEVAKGIGYDKSVDLYSIGVILYILLCGYPPFEPEAGIVDLEFPRKEWGKISKSVIDLITRLLSSDPSERPTAHQLLQNPWVKGEEASTRRLTGTIKTIKKYNIARKTGESMRKKDEVTKATVFNLFDEPPGAQSPDEEEVPTTPVVSTPTPTPGPTVENGKAGKGKKDKEEKEKEKEKEKEAKKAAKQAKKDQKEQKKKEKDQKKVKKGEPEVSGVTFQDEKEDDKKKMTDSKKKK
eukprot:TRINITY_DN15891_c0_g1_i7.p1 TRINITY_DN15891_c0_g1~~TRINITY_DN15891_c0_g1_i7.p1  ORF type:complete len:481 (-),score=146.03 TRINITY_DN15891_c0_g1_i7:355-1620(-)